MSYVGYQSWLLHPLLHKALANANDFIKFWLQQPRQYLNDASIVTIEVSNEIYDNTNLLGSMSGMHYDSSIHLRTWL
jgi:hypothetical protein